MCRIEKLLKKKSFDTVMTKKLTLKFEGVEAEIEDEEKQLKIMKMMRAQKKMCHGHTSLKKDHRSFQKASWKLLIGNHAEQSWSDSWI